MEQAEEDASRSPLSVIAPRCATARQMHMMHVHVTAFKCNSTRDTDRLHDCIDSSLFGRAAYDDNYFSFSPLRSTASIDQVIFEDKTVLGASTESNNKHRASSFVRV